MKAITIIPARLSSTRLAMKLLLHKTGHHLLWHTIQRTLEITSSERTIVATEDVAIYNAVDEYRLQRVQPLMTRRCDSGTERVAVLYERLALNEYDYVINFQGDEPELSGRFVDDLLLRVRPDWDVATLASPATEAEQNSPNVVKVVCGHQEQALYFSRAQIPYGTRAGLKHFGLYVYRPAFLQRYFEVCSTSLPSERLEQLAWLQHGCRIGVVTVNETLPAGIDTPEEYEGFVQRWRK